MRKIIGAVLIGLGAFLLTAAVLGRFWAPGQVERTPLDVDTTTRLEGQAAKLNPGTGEVENLQVKATSVTKADSKASDDEVISFVNTSCLVVDRDDAPDCVDADDPGKRLVTASTDVFATDRKTAVAVNDTKYLGESTDEHAGLINKFPFGTEKKTYEFWDGLLNATVPAEYTGTETLQGLEVYTFEASVPETDAEVVEGVQGKYTSDKKIWVEPTTGSIVNQTQQEVRTLPNGDPLLDLSLAFTPESVTASVEDAKDNVSSLDLVTKTVPLVGLIGGVLCLVGGVVLIATGRRGGAHTEDA